MQFIQVENYIWVANLIGQRGMKHGSNGPPVRYDAIQTGLEAVAKQAKRLKASVHMPRIGCGLAGGKWEQIEPRIDHTLIRKNIEVYVYDFE